MPRRRSKKRASRKKAVSLSSFLKRATDKAKNYPVITAVALIVTGLVGVANAGKALDELGKLWTNWTQPTPVLETTWQGMWDNRNGEKFEFAMQLNIAVDDAATGRIIWKLVAAPPTSHVAKRVGDHAFEYVTGRYDRKERIARLDGYALSDPTLLALDSYKFRIRDEGSFIGMTAYRGDWDAQTTGSVIVMRKDGSQRGER